MTDSKTHYTAIVSFAADEERLETIVSDFNRTVAENSDSKASEITIIVADDE